MLLCKSMPPNYYNNHLFNFPKKLHDGRWPGEQCWTLSGEQVWVKVDKKGRIQDIPWPTGSAMSAVRS